MDAGGTNSLIYYLALAFVGGLILNIMPCVLPVISIKLFGLVKYKNESHSMVLKHNVFYTLGILFTFLVLATIVLSLKSIGSQVGWGFQLQSPNFVAVMIIGLFVFSLNLFGLFEFKTPGGSKLGNLTLNEGFTGDFLSGVLATVLSTPCSAPFLGTALTFCFYFFSNGNLPGLFNDRPRSCLPFHSDCDLSGAGFIYSKTRQLDEHRKETFRCYTSSDNSLAS